MKPKGVEGRDDALHDLDHVHPRRIRGGGGGAHDLDGPAPAQVHSAKGVDLEQGSVGGDELGVRRGKLVAEGILSLQTTPQRIAEP